MAAKQAHAGSAEVAPEPPLRAKFSWDAPGDSGVALSTGILEVSVGGEVVWSGEQGFRWAWVELLDWLAFSWPRLVHEDGLTVDADPPSYDDLRTSVERQIRYLPSAAASDLEIRFWEFLETHDLSRALQGAAPSPIVVWREGRIGHVLTEGSHLRCDWAALDDSLHAIGERVADRVSPAEAIDRAVARTLARWRARDEISGEEAAAAATGLRGERLAPVLDFAVRRGRMIGNDLAENQLLAAARMTSSQPTSVILEVMNALADVKPGSMSSIDEVTQTVAAIGDLAQGKPYEQGHYFGEVFRQYLDLKESQPFDPVEWLSNVGVEYKSVKLSVSSIDALACWSADSGPAVIVNSRGQHSKGRGGRNASVAHEICHLLLDRNGALPAVEVLGGRVSPSIEARARAFAAEVLLPRKYAGLILAQAINETEAEKLVIALSRSHRVSQEVVAWQARNSDAVLHEGVWETLRRFVKSSPWLF